MADTRDSAYLKRSAVIGGPYMFCMDLNEDLREILVGLYIYSTIDPFWVAIKKDMATSKKNKDSYSNKRSRKFQKL